MLPLSLLQCHLLTGGTPCKQATFTSQQVKLPLPLWPARPVASLVALSSLQYIILRHTQPTSRQSQPTNMSSPRNTHHGSPWSPPFSPTLGSIQEVFEYEPLDIPSQPTTPLTPTEAQDDDASAFVLPEPAHACLPTLCLGTRTKGIIVSPRKGRPSLASTKVTNVLRHVLEADRNRRRRTLRIYLKAIVFLKLLLKSHERYGALLATSGMYMQR
ncbi:hypothetical protein BDU57DRAFT_548407 [Ampelomyces quisqualis]|uniref:Uncharacterized protein n=1 Tax=Ampelomyces quisqualis TaxID=50730 RepID=A0A6A5QN30_AMPQU|nr:hypothetical protein BDU57DRAFT_548407 [Ampelomyces quisqualis]